MNKSVKFVLAAAFGVFVLLLSQAVSTNPTAKNEEQINLALRYTAHRLLTAAGDSTSRIPPVERLEKNAWIVRLEHNFEYDSLPSILQKAFATHKVVGDYNVAVLNCGTDDLMLGYTNSLFKTGGEIPCGGREQTASCYDLRVTFLDNAPASDWAKGMRFFFAFLGLTLLFYPVYHLFKSMKSRRLNQKSDNRDAGTITEMKASQEAANDHSPLRFGRSSLHISNQKLLVNGIEKDLTYRESKLLQLFCRHSNQLLERDQILKSVWEDEGIIVGRSVDVFVSRLRKLLKEDETIRITSVHGVGYRMEIQEQAVGNKM